MKNIRDRKEKQRLLISTLLSLGLHVILLITFTLIAINAKQINKKEYYAPLFFDLAPLTEEVVKPQPVVQEIPPVKELKNPAVPTKEASSPAAKKTAEEKPPEKNSPPVTTRNEEPAPIKAEETKVPEKSTAEKPQPEKGILAADSLAELDKALKTKETDIGKSEEKTTPSTTEAQPSSTDSVNFKTDINWDEPTAPRRALRMHPPLIPAWVAERGEDLVVTVGFTLTAEGFLLNLKIEKSSGYSEVDTAVIEAMRKWQFELKKGAANVAGHVTFHITMR